jgi:predicted Zn-dependent protease
VARQAADRLVRHNPSSVEWDVLRAGLCAQAGQWEEAEADCRAALAIHPLYPRARIVLAACRHHRGDPAGGRAEAETAAGLVTQPAARAALLDWYRTQTR